MSTCSTTSQPLTQHAIETAKAHLAEIQAIYTQAFWDLMFEAMQVHQAHHTTGEVQLATLANIKSGKCPEDCKYCPQSSRYQTGIETYDLPPLDEIQAQVVQAKANGASRFVWERHGVPPRMKRRLLMC